MAWGFRGFWTRIASISLCRPLSGYVSLVLLDFLGHLPENVILPVLSIVSQVIKQSQVFSTILAWGVVAAVVHQSIKYAYPKQISLTEENRGLRGLLTGFALAYAIGFEFTSDGYVLVVGMGVFVASVVVLVRYFDSRTVWNLRSPEGRAAELLDQAIPGMASELRSERDYEGRRRTLGVGVWVVAFGTFLAIPCFVAGLAAVVLVSAFPVPDVLLLGFALADSDIVSMPESVQNSLDLERRIYETILDATRSVKGAVLVLVAALGGYFSAEFLSIALPMLSTAAWASSNVISSSSPEAWFIAWNLVGTTTVLATTGVYSFWYWFRQFDRIPRFLELWEREPSGFAGPTRPPWLTVPPTFGVLLVFVFFLVRDTNVSLVRPMFAVAWPLVILALVGCVVWTMKTDPQLPTDEDHAVTVAISIQYVGVWFGGTAEQIDAGRISVSAIVNLLFPAVAIAAIVYLPNVFDFGRDRNDEREFASVAYLLGFGAVAGVAALLVPAYALVFTSLASVCVVGAILIVIGKRLDG